MDTANKPIITNMKKYILSVIISIVIGIDISIFTWSIYHNITISLITSAISISIVFLMCILVFVRVLIILTIFSLIIIIYSTNIMPVIDAFLIYIHVIVLFLILRIRYYVVERELLKKSYPVQVISKGIRIHAYIRSFISLLLVILLSSLILFLICIILYSLIYKWILLTSFTVLFITTIPFSIFLIYLFQKFFKHVVDEVMEFLNIVSVRNDIEYIDKVKGYVVEIARIRGIIGYVGGIELVSLKTITTLLGIGIPLTFYYPFAYKLMTMINPYYGLLVVDLPITFLMDIVISLPMIHGFRILFEKILSMNMGIKAISRPLLLILSSFIEWLIMYMLLGIQEVIWLV